VKAKQLPVSEIQPKTKFVVRGFQTFKLVACLNSKVWATGLFEIKLRFETFPRSCFDFQPNLSTRTSQFVAIQHIFLHLVALHRQYKTVIASSKKFRSVYE
jgi:hypothetical protein